MFVVVPALRPAAGREIFDRSSPWWAYPLFLQNFLVPNSQGAAGPLGVTWSLAIEEQFYLVWPFIVRYGSLAQLSRIAISVICLSPILRLLLSSYSVDLYSNFFCRLDGLMAGAFIAVVMRSSGFVPSKFVTPAWIALIVSTPLAILTDNVETRWVVFSFSAVASTSLVFVSLFSDHKWLLRVMTNRFLIYTGTISYGLYLLHKIPFDAAEQVLNLDGYRLIAAPILLAACLAWPLCPGIAWKNHFEIETSVRLQARSSEGRSGCRGKVRALMEFAELIRGVISQRISSCPFAEAENPAARRSGSTRPGRCPLETARPSTPRAGRSRSWTREA